MEPFEKDYIGKDKDKLPEHAEQYLNRIRGFQNGFIGWAVTWNIAFIGGLFYLIGNNRQENHELFNRIICWFPYVTLFLNICFIVLYLKHSRIAKELVKNYLPDFKTEDCVLKRLLKNATLLVLMILVVQIIIFVTVKGVRP